VAQHGAQQVVDGACQPRLIEQHLEDVEFGHVLGYARLGG
jgi:hypothetical protein